MQFRILGPLEVHDDGRQIALGGPKQRALLGVLLLHVNESISSERLVDELWGDRPPARGHKLVQGYVSGLRKLLGPARVVTRSPGYLARVGARRSAPGELRRPRGRAAERAAPRSAARADRGRPRARASRGARRRAGGARGGAPAPGAVSRPAHARPVPLRPPGRSARALPRDAHAARRGARSRSEPGAPAAGAAPPH